MAMNIKLDVISKEITNKPTQDKTSSVNKNTSKTFDETFTKKVNENTTKKCKTLDKDEVKTYDKQYNEHDKPVDNNKEDKNITSERDKATNSKEFDDKDSTTDEKISTLKEKIEKLLKDIKENGQDDGKLKELNALTQNLMLIMNNVILPKAETVKIEFKVDSSLDNISIDNKSISPESVLKNLMDTPKNMESLLKEMEPNNEAVDMSKISDVLKTLDEALNIENLSSKTQLNQVDQLKASLTNEMGAALNLSKNLDVKAKVENTGAKTNLQLDSNIEGNEVKVVTNNVTDSSLQKENNNNEFNDKTSSVEGESLDQDGKAIKKEDNFLDSLISEKSKNTVNKFNPLVTNRMDINNDSAQAIEQTPVVNKANIVSGIVKNIKYMEANNLKELTVSLNPKDLGSMVIKITVEGGNLSAKIIANKKETYELINSNMADIKNALGNTNDKVQEVSVNIQFGDATAYEQFKEGQGFNENSRNHSHSTSGSGINEASNEEIEEEALNDSGTVNMLA